MKLLYLYIKDYGILKDIEFNFDSEHKFHYDRINKLEEITVSESKLDNNFFFINNEKNLVVESISALIGNNGAGKTTIANFLYELSISRNKPFEFIAVTKMRNKLECNYCLMKPEIGTADIKFIIKTNFLNKELYLDQIKELDEKNQTIDFLKNPKKYKIIKDIVWDTTNKECFDHFSLSLDSQVKPSIRQNGSNCNLFNNFKFYYYSNLYTPMHVLL